MCTVSFVPGENGVFITSNRDENISRSHTLPPKMYLKNGFKIFYPQDVKSKGTWIGYNEFGTVAILLNGAFVKHQQAENYKQSRGLIIPFILSNINSLNALQTSNFFGIEPFTIVLYQNNNLYECRWDATSLYTKQLQTNKAYLWNSVTLYTNKIEHENNLQMLSLWHKNITREQIFNFHNSKKYELQLPLNSIENNIKTVSITLIDCQNEHIAINYENLINSSNPIAQ